MKRIINSASLVALGAASLQAASGQTIETDNQKPWSVSVAVRGFYDSNYSLSPNHPTAGVSGPQHSWGAEVTPSASYFYGQNTPTSLSSSALATMKYYAQRPNNDADYMYQGSVNLDHKFNENYEAKVSDAVVYAQDPAILEQGAVITAVGTGPVNSRDNISALHNTGKVDFLAQFCPLFGGEFTYNNNFYSYDDPIYAAILNRIEQLASADARYTLDPATFLLAGYQFGYTDFNDSGLIAPGVTSSSRNTYSHYFYLGADHTFVKNLSGSLRLGLQYTDYYNDPSASSPWNPYADANLTWAYMDGCTATVGVRHSRNATDVTGTGIGGATALNNLILDQETTAVYANLNHKFTSKISGSLLAQYQNSAFSGAGSSAGSSVLNDTDQYFIAGANAAYHFNQYFLAEAGYNFDKLNSQIVDRGFTRHVVYLGFRATY
jgi:hypothetical protein